LNAGDDRFHPSPTDDAMWTETTWWGFSVPDVPLGGMVYALFRPNLGVAALVTHVWDADAVESWRAPYGRSLWHLPMPDSELDDACVGPLHVRAVEPLTEYELAYEDGDRCRVDLRYRAAMSPHVVMAEESAGHFDQLCRVTGEVGVGGRSYAVDTHALRDRSWYVRDDWRSLRTAYTYGAAGGDHHFLAYSGPEDDTGACQLFGGYLVRDGHKAALSQGVRRVVGRRRGHPDEVELVATDADDRTLHARGKVTASLASQSTPGMFAWMSVASWDIDGDPGHGEDHDVWSPDHLPA
jgi:hypothetical protein